MTMADHKGSRRDIRIHKKATLEPGVLTAGNDRRRNLYVRIPAIVTTGSDGLRPPVPIDRDQFDGAVRCIF